jgi:hypothetical protein
MWQALVILGIVPRQSSLTPQLGTIMGKSVLCWTCEGHFIRRQEKRSSVQLLTHVNQIRGKRYYEKYFFKNLPLIGGIDRIPC